MAARSPQGASTTPEMPAVMNNLLNMYSSDIRVERVDPPPEIPSNLPMPSMGDIRPELAMVRRFFESRPPASEMVVFEEIIASITADKGNPVQGWVIKGLFHKCRADELFNQKQYADAKNAYLEAIRITLGQDDSFVLPSSTAFNDVVARSVYTQFADIVTCANNISQCCIHEKKESEALDWIEEVHCWYRAYTDARQEPDQDYYLSYLEYVVERVKAWLRQTQIFTSLGNSAGAVSASWEGFKYGSEFSTVAPFVETLREQCQVAAHQSKRHPDPEAFDKVQITHPDLQVKGAWKKIRLPQPTKEGPGSRLGFASFVRHGKYYVFGGQHATRQLHLDGWVLDLRAMTGWRPVPYPPTSSAVLFHRMAVWEDKAYLFQGTSDVLVFDVLTEKWSKVATKMRDGTLWTKVCPRNHLFRYAIEAHNNVLYVFGGGTDISSIGRNTLMALDLKTRTWEILSGTVEIKYNYLLPGLREYPASWLVNGKIYVTLGSANYSGALAAGNPLGNEYDHTYEDLWSYDIDAKQWTPEKLSGNTPCPRTKVGITFNQKWNRAAVFGGYNSRIPFRDEAKNTMWPYNYFGDTFVWFAETGKWAQVIARGFPTYRAMSDLVTDQETGKTYLFGGCTSTDFTPSTRAIMQSFNDLWELSLDVPGSDFDTADFEVDPRFSKLGPWKRCYSCGGVGRWKMCGGTCRKSDQPAYFCGTDCQRARWAEHKQQNGCRKA